MPKFFELCLDDVASVREKVALHSTASILHSFLGSDYLKEFINQMKEFKESNRYNFRQSFVCMIESIFLDFCESSTDLIKEIVLPNFMQDLLDISMDRVVNVRIQLAECFYHFYKKFEGIQSSNEHKEKTMFYLNRHFFKILRNLKYDPSEGVREFLYNIEVSFNETVSEDLNNSSPSKVVVEMISSQDS